MHFMYVQQLVQLIAGLITAWSLHANLNMSLSNSSSWLQSNEPNNTQAQFRAGVHRSHAVEYCRASLSGARVIWLQLIASAVLVGSPQSLDANIMFVFCGRSVPL
jgi:hypothetical protein